VIYVMPNIPRIRESWFRDAAADFAFGRGGSHVAFAILITC
jgi:hypothetical protein